MARIIRLRLTGKAEQFLDEMSRRGFNQRDLMANALGLLAMARDRRVAEVNTDGSIERVFTLEDELLGQEVDFAKFSENETSEPEVSEDEARVRETGEEMSVPGTRVHEMSEEMKDTVSKLKGRDPTESRKQRAMEILRGLSEDEQAEVFDRLRETGLD